MLDVRNGSKPNISVVLIYVRFTPKNGHGPAPVGCPLSANSGLMQCSKGSLFKHLVGELL